MFECFVCVYDSPQEEVNKECFLGSGFTKQNVYQHTRLRPRSRSWRSRPVWLFVAPADVLAASSIAPGMLVVVAMMVVALR